MRRDRASIIALALGLAACGARSRALDMETDGDVDSDSDSDTDADSDGDTDADVLMSCTDIGRAFARAAFECCGDYAITEERAEFEGSAYRETCEWERASERISIDPDLEATCIEANLAAWVACASSEAEVCDAARSGIQAEEEPCLYEGECADGLFCPAERGATCRRLPVSGEPCVGRRCAEGHYCDGSDRCARALEEGDPCPDRWGCADGLYCEETTGRCTPTLEDGAPCSDPHSCIPGICSDDGVCVPPPFCWRISG